MLQEYATSGFFIITKKDVLLNQDTVSRATAGSCTAQYCKSKRQEKFFTPTSFSICRGR